MIQETQTTKNPYHISSLLVEIGAAQVEVRMGSEFSLTVSDNTCYESTVENGTWIIRGKPAGLRWMLGEQTTRYLICLPQGTTLDALTLNIGAGMLNADGLQAQTARLEVGAGKMVLQHLFVAGACFTSVGAGMLTLTGALAGRSKIHCGMGLTELCLARPADYGYHAQCAMGNIKVDGVSTAGLASNRTEHEHAPTFYEIDCGMGSVNVQFSCI